MSSPSGESPLRRLAKLPARSKEPNSARMLDDWPHVGVGHGRLGWLVASTVVVAALQRVLNDSHSPHFLLKGGTYLQHRLDWAGRATKDVDGIIKGDIDEFVDELDRSFREPWGPLTLTRTEIEVIAAPTRVLKPCRFDVKVSLRGQVWRSVKVEISPDEAGIASEAYPVPAPTLKHFGLPSPNELLGIALRFQIAQKFHACTDLHNPPDLINDRPRDLVDLLLLRELVGDCDPNQAAELKDACVAVFVSRADEALQLQLSPRFWPPNIVAYYHWRSDFAKAAEDAGLALTLDESVEQLNHWIATIDRC